MKGKADELEKSDKRYLLLSVTTTVMHGQCRTVVLITVIRERVL